MMEDDAPISFLARLDREVTRLRESLADNQAAPAGQPQPREQKAIERQSALVAPEPFNS